jgi:hypothetical protein
MPAFTFEKIAPPPAIQSSAIKGSGAAAVKGSVPAEVLTTEKKPRRMIVLLLGRLIEPRRERVPLVENTLGRRRQRREGE